MADHVVYTGFDPAFGDKLNQLIALAKAKGYSPQLISGRRDAYGWPGMKGQSQAELYSQLGKPGGPKAAAPPGYSPHQYGVAGDVAGLPQSVLEQLASQVGLRAIHSDPNHLELPNWQQAAATQPPMTAWNESNPANVPTRMAMNMEADGPPGTKINGSAPIAGALSRPSVPTPGTPVNDFYHASMMHETGGKNVANAAGGAAGGYYQFMPATYGTVRKARPDLNLPDNVMAANLDQQTEAYREFTKGNVAALQAANIPINDKNVFMASFLGSGGATKFLGQMGQNPDANAADLFPKEAKSNPGVFYADGQPRTLQQVYDLQTKMHGSGNTTGFGPDAAPAPASVASGTDAAANAADQPWWSKIVQGSIDPATGEVDPKAKTPLQQALGAVTKAAGGGKGDETPQQIQKGARPDETALTGAPAPLSRNTSPLGGALLPSVSQTYGQTLNSYERPLTYNAAPPQAPQTPTAGFQGGFAPGISLNSLPPLPQGFPGQIRPLTLDEYGYQGAGYAS